MMVSPRTSTETIRNMGRRGDLNKRRKYDGNRGRRRVYGRSTISFLLAAELQRLNDVAELRKAAAAVSLLPPRTAAQHIQDYGCGRERAGCRGDPLSSARSDRRCVG